MVQAVFQGTFSWLLSQLLTQKDRPFLAPQETRCKVQGLTQRSQSTLVGMHTFAYAVTHADVTAQASTKPLLCFCKSLLNSRNSCKN